MWGAVEWDNFELAAAFILGATLATVATIRVVRAVSTMFGGELRRRGRASAPAEGDEDQC